MKTGIELIAQEREEQIERHDYSIQHDVNLNSGNQLLQAIMLVVSNVSFRRAGISPMPQEAFEDLKPDGWDAKACTKFCDKNDIESLKLIGGWAAAEIDRLQHA